MPEIGDWNITFRSFRKHGCFNEFERIVKFFYRCCIRIFYKFLTSVKIIPRFTFCGVYGLWRQSVIFNVPVFLFYAGKISFIRLFSSYLMTAVLISLYINLLSHISKRSLVFSKGIYLTVTMGMTSLSIILTVFVLQLHHVGPHKRPVPGWMRTLVCKVFARVVCMSRDSHPFAKRQPQEHQIKRYHPRGGKVERGKERPPSPNPKVVVESCDSSTATQLHRDVDGHGDLRTDVPPYDSCGSNLGDGNGSFSANTKDNNKFVCVNTSSTLSPGLEQRGTMPSVVRDSSESNAITKPSSQGGNFNSTRNNNCNGEVFFHQRDRVAPVNISDLGQTSLDYSEPSTQGLQCREYAFHEPDSYSHSCDQMGRGFGGRISRSPSFRSRSSSFRGDNYRASFRAAYPVVRDGGGGVESPIAAGGGGMYVGGGYTDPSYDAYQQLVMEWQFIAHVMDRLLFWLFLFVALISSIAILVIKPLFKPPLEETFTPDADP